MKSCNIWIVVQVITSVIFVSFQGEAIAQTTISQTCEAIHSDNETPKDVTVEDKTIVEKFIPSSFGEVSCSYLTTELSSVLYYFILYDYSPDIQADTERKLYLRAVRMVSSGDYSVVAELTPEEIDPSPPFSYEGQIKEIKLTGRNEFLLSLAIRANRNNLYYFAVFDGYSLRPVGPDWRHNERQDASWNLERRYPITDFEQNVTNSEGSQNKNYVIAMHSSMFGVSQEEYLVPTNIYEPWPISHSIALLDTAVLKKGDNETREAYSFTNLPNGYVKEEKTFSLGAADAGGSFFVSIEYPNGTNIPSNVILSQGEKILYQGPSANDRLLKKANFRLKDADLTSSDNIKFSVEGDINSTVSFSFERPTCDINQDGYVDSLDIGLIRQGLGQSVAAEDFRDFSGDGLIGEEDVKGCEQTCNVLGCDVSPLDVYVPPQGPSLSAIEVNQKSVEAGGPLTITISLSQVSTDEQVTLSSSNPVITLPSVITIPSGATSAELTILAGDVLSETPVTLTANYKGETKTVDVIVKPKPIVISSFVVSPSSVQSGASITLSATLSRVSTVPETVMVSSDNASIAVSSISIPAGSSSGSCNVTVGNVNKDTIVTITANYNQTNLTTQVIIKPKATIITKIINIIKALLTRLFG